MLKIRHLLAALLICSALAATCAFAQSTFTQIRDVVTNPDGSPFNGVVLVTWNGYSSPGGTPVSELSASARIYNGALSVLLVPTTTAVAGTYYEVVYNSSDGTVTWSETWQVPPSTTALTLSQVRQTTTEGSGTGTTSGGGNYATLPITISQVTGLSDDLSTINASLATLNTQLTALNPAAITALTTTVNGLTTTVNGLTTTVNTNSSSIGSLTNSLNTLGTTVTGLTTTVNGNSTSITSLTSSLSTLGTTVSGLTTSVGSNGTAITGLTNSLASISGTVSGLTTSVNTLNGEVASINATLSTLSSGSVAASFVDAAVPSGSINGTNTSFTLASAPSPAASLNLYRNGLLQTSGEDYVLSGTSITFSASSIPQTGDIMQAFYRIPGTGPANTLVDSEVPGGAINGTNLAFTLANAPNPATSLKLYKNGLLMSQGGDYTLSGSTITFVSAAVPASPDQLQASYRY